MNNYVVKVEDKILDKFLDDEKDVLKVFFFIDKGIIFFLFKSIVIDFFDVIIVG